MIANTSLLFEYIEKTSPLSKNEKIILGAHFTEKKFKKGAELLTLHQTCKTLHFVISGVFRNYKIHTDKEITNYFSYSQRNPFVASFETLLTGNNNDEIIECIEDGVVISIPYSKWSSIYLESESLNTFGRKMAEFNYLLAIERIASLQFKDASHRYNSFLTNYPGLLNRIPHHYIASYIGITPESFSRIRKKI